MSSPHPLDPLSASELAQSVATIKSHVLQQPNNNNSRFWFKAVSLCPPPKKELTEYLEARYEGKEVQTPVRRAEVLVGVKNDKTVYFEYYLTLGDTPTVDEVIPVTPPSHVGADGDEMIAAEEALFKNEVFLAAIADLRLPAGATLVADGWIYGSDTTEDMPRLLPFMVYYRLSTSPDSNHYAFPLPLIPVLEPDNNFALHEITYTPIMGGESIKTIKDWVGEFPWEKEGREYDRALMEEKGEKEREGLKPYIVSQLDGPSFTTEGRAVRWQKWSFHIGFNFREGPVINDVRYDGRQVFHRLSVSDMTVPYGDPREPFHRKQAFDLGDVGAGLMANELSLGCDCLGHIQYFDFDHVTADGGPGKMRNVLCLHEQDEGILWKHTNYRTGKASVARMRVLVVQTVITVANYEYIFAWKFDQAANIHLETRATGILSTCLIAPGEMSPYGTIVGPGVLATNHQHIFSVRIDPAIDGHNNTVVQEESVAMPFSAANRPANNPHGVGYTVETTPIKVSGWADAAPWNNRVFKIINPSKINPISGRAMGYKLVPEPSQLLLAHPESIAYARAEFAQHHIWVTKYRDNELYSAGKYTNQSCGEAKGINSWVDRKDDVENTDIVVWHSFGLTHNPRVEDWPVMPSEVHTISLKPVDFFTSSPANDVPASTQAVNSSTLVAAAHLQGTSEVKVEVCCDH